jgi:cell division protease FtsH
MPDQMPPNTPPGNGGPRRSPLWQRLILPIAFLAIMLFLFGRVGDRSVGVQVAYSDFKVMVANNQVATVFMRGDVVEGRLHGTRSIGPGGQQSQTFTTRMPAAGDQALLPLLEEHGVTVNVEPPASETGWGQVLLALLPWVVFIGLYFWFMRRFSRNVIGGIGRGGDLGKFLKPRDTVEVKRPDVTFDDVAGQDNAKREVAELLEYFAHPERYQRLGAEVPHGVLLLGPPGTGKTLLARALAGEAGVPFYSISASEFIEVFVGVGASRVRGTGLGGGHDEREQTLNQILAEMDGFSGHEAVIVLAATNRPDVLDPALLRPGRFDRHIVLDLPDRKARTAILEVHTADVPLDEDVDLEQVSAGTPGFSGADLKNLVNEAAMRAARENRSKVEKEDFDTMRDRVLMGTERSLVIQPGERHRLAVHESGHTAVAYFLPEADPLYKVSIIPRGKALGGTQQLPEAERYTLPEDYLRDRLAVILAGRTAERMLLGNVSSGADDDIRQATALARAMVARWGMSSDVGPVDLRDSEEHPFLGRVLQEAEARAEKVISTHREKIERLIAMLEEQETLHREQIEDCLGRDGPVEKKAKNVARLK